MDSPRPSKSERINLRLDPMLKEKIQSAADFLQLSVSSFMLSSVLEAAEKVIREHEVMKLSDRDRDLFLNALLDPPAPNRALKNAFALHEKMTGSDN